MPLRPLPFLALLLALTACAARAGAGAEETTDPLTGRTWTVVALDGAPVDGADAPTLHIGADEVDGTTGVNRFTATTTRDRDRVTVERVITTRRVGTPPAMARERAFLAALRAGRTWGVADGVLELRDADGALRLRAVGDR